MGVDREIEPAASQLAYRELERQIVTLELVPAALTTEAALIERVGLGRTPVREAIQRLAWEGLLEVRPRSGIAVAPLNPSDWMRVLDVRLGVEPVLARAAARLGTGDLAQAFRQAGSLMESAARRMDVAGFLQADKALDDALAQASDNPFAARLAAPLQSHSRRFWFRYQARAGLAPAAARHIALVEAIVSGDEAAAAAAAAYLVEMLKGQAARALLG